MNMTTTKQHKATHQGRMTRMLLFLLLLMAGAQGAWAVDDTFTVPKNATGEDIVLATGGTPYYKGQYSSLTLGFTGDANVFKIENDKERISGDQNPTLDGSYIPNGGHVFVFRAEKAGEFIFTFDLNESLTVYVRDGSGNIISQRTNTSGKKENKYQWVIKVDNPGTYYLYGKSTKIYFYGYTFTRKVPAGITSLPYHADFSSDIEPFDDGNVTSGTNVSNVYTLNSVAPNSGTAIARFNGIHTLKSTEQVTLSYTAYHGYYNKGGESRVTLYNSNDRPLVSYTYDKLTCKITDVSFNEETADGLQNGIYVQSRNGTGGGNGFVGNGRPYTNNAGDNPVITITINGNGMAMFNVTLTKTGVNTTFNGSLAGELIDLAYLKIEDTSVDADSGYGIDNLSITSKLASLDYETEVVDWTTSVSGRYTPVILTESTNHYLSVDQSQRNDGNGGTTLTSTSLSGIIAAGQDFTLEFDMKVGNNNRSGTSGPPSFTVFAANNSNYIFKMESSNTTTGWQINGTESVTLEGTGVTNGTDITSLTWYHYKISKTNGYTYVTITSADGSTTYMRKGISNSAGGLGNLQYITGKHYANFAIDNIQVVPYASTLFTQNGKVETYTIMGEGALPQSEQGKTIGIEYGTTEQVQMTAQNGTYFGAYCVDNNTSGVYSRAWGTVPSTIFGTYYKLTPVYDGTLSVTGWVSGKNNLVLVDNSNNLIASKPAADLTANTLFTYDFTPTLTGGSTYYLFVADSGTGHNTTGEGIADDGVFYLSNLTFTQTHMNRDVAVKDLLYAGNKSGDNLGRTIPGMTLAFNDKVTSGVGRDYLNFETDGTMTITLRQNGYNATVSGVILVNNGTKLNTGYTVNTSVSGVATITASESLSVSGFIVSYNGDGGESNYKLWLNEDKTDIGTLAVANSHIMRVPGDGRAFTNAITFSGDDANKWWVENTDYLHTSSNTSIATINTDGTNGQLLKSGAATITTTFQETDYFNEKSISYTVDNVLRNDDVTYNVDVTTGKILRVGAYADAASTALLFNGSHTSETSFTYGTTLEKQYTRATSDGTVILKNETANNITINTLQTFSSNVVAWLYYEGQENNYSMQMQFQNFASGDVRGFRVLDIGDSVDPIDLTDAYEWKSDSYFAWSAGTPAWTLSGQFINSNGSFTPSSKGEGDITVLPTVSRTLSRKKGMATAYDNNTYNEITATANIFIATPSDEDSDGTIDTYQKWDLTTTITGSGQMDSRWTWSSYRRCYQTYLPDYLPILNRDGNALAGNEGLLVKGTMRYHIGANALRLNLTAIDAGIKFPVKKGMEVKIEIWSESADVNHLISNVTDIAGNATNKLYTEYATETVTAYFLAEEDNVIELLSMDKIGGHVKSITLQTPHIHFNEEIVTVLATGASYTNQPYNASTGADLEYTIAGEYSLPTTYNGEGAATESIATINSSTGIVTVTGTEGYAIVNVVDNNATGLQPRKGSYRLYVIDFRFAPTQYDKDTDTGSDGADEPDLDLSSSEAIAQGGEALFRVRPDGYDKVVQPVKYTMEYYVGTPRGRLTQNTNTDPRLTTYELSAYSAGTIRVTATTGRISTYCDVVISGGNNFAEIAPITRLEDLSTEMEQYYFLNELPSGFNSSSTTYIVDKSGDISCDRVTTISQNDAESVTHYYAKISNITGTGGALRVTATDNNNTPENATDDKTATFILTVAYPASTGHMWDFYRMKHYTHDAITEYGLYIGELDNLVTESTISNMTISSHSATQRNTSSDWNAAWTTEGTNWNRIYRKGEEQPRWAVERSMKGDNAFIIEETAGLIIETGQNGLYTDNPHQPTEFSYNHIGLHNNATITIPQLKKGDYISLNLNRVIPNNGAILSATNAEDLAGNAVDHSFTITRSQTDYNSNGLPATDNTGARVIPGFYTFRATNDGDVSFTLEDEGYLDILSIEIYGKTTNMPLSTDAGQGNDPDNGYRYTMTNIKVDDSTYSDPTAMFLMDTGDTETIDLAICNVLWSTSVGPAEYVLLEEKGNLDATFNSVEWFSNGGAGYNKGHITVNGGSYGKMRIRMNNYTEDGRYLIGYTPDYALTVGHPPHQDYPYTWNFTNISGGAVKGKGNNAFNNISSDPYTWTSLGYETYQLDTRTSGGSLYVPGATLVTTNRDLGAKGTIAELNRANLGCDELNGLGFTGQIKFRTALQASTEPAAPAALNGNNSLLEYKMTEAFGAYTKDNETITWAAADKPTAAETKTYWTAGDGLITFGSAGKRQTSTIAAGGAVYLMDGGVTKYLLIKPERALKEGDVITLKGYTPTNVIVQNSGFSFYAAQLDNAYDDLLTLNWETSDNTQEHTITHTVQQGDGLAGRDSVYIFRAGKQYSVYLTEISITTTDETTPTIAERALTCNGDVTVTIPDLVANHYVYIKSSAAPKTIPSNLTAAVAADGLDAIEDEEVGGIHKHVYKYKVLAAGNADVTFASGTKVYRIGVTDIMKKLKRVGEGDAWATESRGHAIDYTQTGHFTVNDIKANTVTAKSYTGNKVTVKLNEKTDAMPAETGMVLKLAYNVDKFNKTKNYNSTDVTGEVPLFYPPYSQNILSYDLVKFGGTEGNLMMANLDTRLLTQERETGVIDKDGDDVDDSGNAEGDYTRFIFAYRYMKWTKIDNDVQHTDFTNSGNAPVFYRLHLYTTTQDGKTATQLNTLDANKAYLLIRSGNVPDALWKDQASPAKRFIGIEGISDIYEFTDDSEDTERSKHQGIYNMQGQKIDEGSTLPAGIYIINGRKIVVH